MNKSTRAEMKDLNYKICGSDGSSIESDSVSVGNPIEWVKGQREMAELNGYEISIWDNEGNSY